MVDNIEKLNTENNKLDIQTKRLDDGTTVLKMANFTYEYPVAVAPIYKRAA